MIALLWGREDALAPFGWTGPRAEWIALAYLNSGVFTRVQLPSYLRVDRRQALRCVQALLQRGLAAEDTRERRRVYRALGAEHIRHVCGVDPV